MRPSLYKGKSASWGDEVRFYGDEDGRRIDEDGRHGNEVSGPSKIATIF